MEYPKTRRQAKKILLVLYIVKPTLKFFWWKKCKNNKTISCLKRLLIKVMQEICNFEILNSFNPELQFKNTEFAIINKVKKLLTELRV